MEETSPLAKPDVVVATAKSWHRLLELVSVVAFTLLQAAGWLDLVRPSQDFVAFAALATGLALGWVLSDASSGLVHFLADNYGHESWPFVGAAFIRPFREHHRDPLAILRHGFLERNGNNALIALLAFAWVPIVDVASSPVVRVLAATCLSWGLWTVATNQIHAWAHARAVPRWVRWGHRIGLLLSPQQHERHHQPPYRSNYCITSGLLDRLRHPSES